MRDSHRNVRQSLEAYLNGSCERNVGVILTSEVRARDRGSALSTPPRRSCASYSALTHSLTRSETNAMQWTVFTSYCQYAKKAPAAGYALRELASKSAVKSFLLKVRVVTAVDEFAVAFAPAAAIHTDACAMLDGGRGGSGHLCHQAQGATQRARLEGQRHGREAVQVVFVVVVIGQEADRRGHNEAAATIARASDSTHAALSRAAQGAAARRSPTQPLRAIDTCTRALHLLRTV